MDTFARQRVSPAGRHRSSFVPLRLSVLDLAARNAPKCHHSRLYRASIFVSVVAEPIQDLSAVSITDETVGIGLPRLRYGAAIVWRTKHPIKSHPKLDALTAEKVFGWKNVHKHGRLVGRPRVKSPC